MYPHANPYMFSRAREREPTPAILIAPTVAALLDSTAVQRVQVLGGTEPDPATTLLTRGFLRPRWSEGALVLHVQPAARGVLVPFETPDPTPCCAAHA